MPKKKTHEQYENELIDKNIEFIVLEKYVNAKTPIIHMCSNGHNWRVTPDNILKGRGCPDCSGNKKHTDSSYLSKLLERRIYNYIPVESIINSSTPILHKCLSCNNTWKVRPYDIMQGKGCPSCAKTGFDSSKEAILYFVSFYVDSIKYYKLGITNRSTEHRFGAFWKRLNMRTEWDILFSIGRDALNLETELLRKFDTYKVNTGALPNGNTETISVYIPKPKIILDRTLKSV